MSIALLEVLKPGVAASLQDAGRPRWKRFGIPRSGWMDAYSALWANRLAGNLKPVPVVECAWHGARFKALHPVRIGLSGAISNWRSVMLQAGETLELEKSVAGLWNYLAVDGGFLEAATFGSTSYYARGGLGKPLAEGEILHGAPKNDVSTAVATRRPFPDEIREYTQPPILTIDPGAQWDLFSPETREQFLSSIWSVDLKSDRVGYRLEGPTLDVPKQGILSEPMLTGTIQVPPNGQPIVVMRDGPAVGGYPKIAIVTAESLDWLAQIRPGKTCVFQHSETNKKLQEETEMKAATEL